MSGDRNRLDEFIAAAAAQAPAAPSSPSPQPSPQPSAPAPEPKGDGGGGGFWGAVGGAVGTVGSVAGGAVRVAGGAVDTFGDAGDRVSSWMNPHNNGSKADFLTNEQQFYAQHGPQSVWDVDTKMDYRKLESTRPHGLEPSNEWNTLGTKLKGGGNAIEATGKFGETFIREPTETAQTAWDNRGEIAHGVTEYTKNQFSRKALAEWALAAGAAATIATARTGAAGGGAVEPMAPHVEAPHLEAPAPAPHVAEPNLSRPASSPAPKVEFPEVAPAEAPASTSNSRMGRLDTALEQNQQFDVSQSKPETTFGTSKYSRSVTPTLFPRARQWMANIVAGSPEAEGLVPSVRRAVAQSKFEPSGIEPSGRPNSLAAEAGPSAFRDYIWESKQWFNRAAKVKLASDIATVGAGGKDGDPDRVTDAIKAYDPEKGAAALGAYNDFAHGRSARRVAVDTLTDPSEQAKALDLASSAGIDASTITPAITDFAKGHMPTGSDYIIPGALALGGLALKSGIVGKLGDGDSGGSGGGSDSGSSGSRAGTSSSVSAGGGQGEGEGVRSPGRVGYSSGSYSAGRGFAGSQRSQGVGSGQAVRDPYAGGDLDQETVGEVRDPYRQKKEREEPNVEVHDPYQPLSPLRQPVRA